MHQSDNFDTVEIQTLGKGDFFRFPGKKMVYVYDGYNRSIKKYEYHKFEDINDFGSRKKGAKVEINFEF